MKRWEYSQTPSLGTDFNAKGAEGWEFAGADGTANVWWKRELPDDSAPAADETASHWTRLHQTLDRLAAHLEGQPRTAPYPQSHADQAAATQSQAAPASPVSPPNTPADPEMRTGNPADRAETTHGLLDHAGLTPGTAAAPGKEKAAPGDKSADNAGKAKDDDMSDMAD